MTDLELFELWCDKVGEYRGKAAVKRFRDYEKNVSAGEQRKALLKTEGNEDLSDE